VSIAIATLAHSVALSQDSNVELAKKLSNPIADLISVSFQGNYDCCFGTLNGNRHAMNIQPVVPIGISADWNLIVRTILPIVAAQAPTAATGDMSGISDIVQSFFFSPKALSNGWTWGAGPVFLYPTAAPPGLGASRWGAGPTAVVLKQESGWTYGVLANHIWSFAHAGGGGREVSATFLQPFLAYTTKSAMTILLNTESTYDWIGNQWTVPINLMLSQLFKIGSQPISLQLGPRYYVEIPNGGPRWGGANQSDLLVSGSLRACHPGAGLGSRSHPISHRLVA
jgi:hypothetical protein